MVFLSRAHFRPFDWTWQTSWSATIGGGGNLATTEGEVWAEGGRTVGKGGMWNRQTAWMDRGRDWWIHLINAPAVVLVFPGRILGFPPHWRVKHVQWGESDGNAMGVQFEFPSQFKTLTAKKLVLGRMFVSKLKDSKKYMIGTDPWHTPVLLMIIINMYFLSFQSWS